VFNDGIIQQIGAPRVIYEQPDNSFVAQFIGENNRLDGMVESMDGADCVVRLSSGECVTALAVNVTGPGQQTSISLRPEKVQLKEPSGGAPRNRIMARVRDLLYLGDHSRLLLTVDADREFAVKQPIGTAMAALTPGDNIPLYFSASDCRALDPV
jgi:putative spermidine/putrescine transport system ATP-binding protein